MVEICFGKIDTGQSSFRALRCFAMKNYIFAKTQQSNATSDPKRTVREIWSIWYVFKCTRSNEKTYTITLKWSFQTIAKWHHLPVKTINFQQLHHWGNGWKLLWENGPKRDLHPGWSGVLTVTDAKIRTNNLQKLCITTSPSSGKVKPPEKLLM